MEPNIHTSFVHTHTQQTDTQMYTTLTDFPAKLTSPLNEARDPVKENMGSGTGMGTLIPICRGKIHTYIHTYACMYICTYGNCVRAYSRCSYEVHAELPHCMKFVCHCLGSIM